MSSATDKTRLALRAMLSDFPAFILPSEAELAELLYAYNPVVEHRTFKFKTMADHDGDVRLSWNEAQGRGHAPRYFGAAALLIEILTDALNEARRA